MAAKTLNEVRQQYQQSISEAQLITDNPGVSEYHTRLQVLRAEKAVAVTKALEEITIKYDEHIARVESELAMFLVMTSEITNE